MRTPFQIPNINSKLRDQFIQGRTFNNRLFGTYRGIVKQINDALKLGYVRVYIPVIHNNKIPPEKLPLAYVVQPYGGGRNYGQFYIPPVGSAVFVQFEDGNPESPLVIGCWYGDVVKQDENDPKKVIKITEEVPKTIKNCFVVHKQEGEDDELSLFASKAEIDIEQRTGEKEPYDSTDSYRDINTPEPRNLIIKSFKGHTFEIDDTGIGDLETSQSTIHNEGIRFTTRKGQIIHIIDQPNKEAILIKNGDEVDADGNIIPGNYIQIDQVNKNINIYSNNNLSEEVTTDSVKHVGGDELSTIDNNKNTKIIGNKTDKINGNWTVLVKGNIDITVVGNCTLTSGGTTTVNTGGNVIVDCKGSMNTTVLGSMTATVAGSMNTTVAGPITVTGASISLNP